MPADETEVTTLFAKFEPARAKLGKALHRKLRARLPGLNELVYFYERQHALVITYSPTKAGGQGVCAVAVYPDRVNLCFIGGAALARSDRSGLLQGSGKAMRFVPMSTPADFDRAEIETLLQAALSLAKVEAMPSAPTKTIVKAAEQKARAKKATAAKSTKAPTAKRRVTPTR